MSIKSPRRLFGSLVIVVLTALLLLVFALAVASVLQITDGERVGRQVAAEAPTDGLTTDSEPVAATQVAINDAGLGRVGCHRATVNGAVAQPFVVSIIEITGNDDLLTVEVRLSGPGEADALEVVPFGVVTKSPLLEEPVPNSFDAAIDACTVTAIQRGRRVLLTGR